MKKSAKEYMGLVANRLMRKYNVSEISAYKMIKQSFLYDSLIRFPEETIHDSIDANADFVYEDYMAEHLLQM